MSNCTAKCPRSVRVLNLPMFAIALTLFTTFGAYAAQKVWNGSGTNWSAAASWSPNGVPAAGDDLVFAGSLNLASNNDLAAGTLFNSITFAPSAGAFTLSGNSFGINTSITNNNVNAQTINNNVLLGNGSTANIAFNNNTLGLLTFGGNVTGGSGGAGGVQTLTIAGAGPITIAGTISAGATAAALILTDTSSSTLSLNGTGNTLTTLNINTVGGYGVVDIGANGLALNALNGSSALQATFGGTINATGGGLLTVAQSSATVGGKVGTQIGTLTINAQITGSNCLEAYSNPTAGVLVLANAANNFTGDLIISAGTVSVASIGNPGAASPVGQGRIRLNNLATSKLSYTGAGESNTRVIDLMNGTTGGVIEQAGTGLLQFTSNLTVSAAGAKTLVLQGSTLGTAEFAGVIADSTSGATAITKSGTGAWLLSAANTNTGTTTVANGTLTVGNGTTGSLNGTTGTPLTFTGSGTFIVNEANTGVNQGMGTLTLSAGDATIQSNYGASGNSAITFSSLAARAAGATANFVINGGTNGTTNKIVLTGQTVNTFLNQGLFFNGADYVWYDAGGFVRAINYGVDAGAVTNAGGTSQASTAHLQVTGSLTTQAAATFTTVKIVGATNITTIASAAVITNGILKTGGGASTYTFTTTAGSLTAAASTELVVRTDGATDTLTISDPVINSTATPFTKAGLGTLSMGTAAVCTYTGTTTLNAGITTASVTTSLGAVGTANVIITNGATLQLAGNGTANNINFGTRTFFVAGTGASGRFGCIENISAITQTQAISKLTLTDNAAINCAGSGGTAGEIDIRQNTPAINFNGFTLTKVGSSPFNIPVACACTNSTGANGNIPGVSVAYTAGTLNSVESTVSFAPNTGAVLVTSGATMYTYQPTMSALVCPPIILSGGKFQHYPDGGSYTWPGTIVLAPGTINTIDNNSATANSTFTLSGQITGSGNLITTETTASALIIFTGNNNYSGTTTVSTNQLQIGAGGAAGALGPGAVTVNNATTLIFNRSDAGLIVPGLISGGGAVMQSGAGTTTLLGANSYTGATTVNAGGLVVDNVEAINLGISFPAGTSLGGVGTIPVGITATGAAISPGDSVAPGTLTFSAATVPLTANATTALNFRLNGAPGAGGVGNDYINVPNGDVALASTNLINLSGTPKIGTYTLISSGTSVTGTPTLNLNSTGLPAVLANTGTAITVTFTGGITWTGLGADTNWTTAANWTPSAPVGNAGEYLTFPAGAAVKTSNNNFTPGTTFANIAVTGAGYTLTGNGIVFTGNPALIVSTSSGTTSVAIPISGTGSGVTINGTGSTVILSGANRYTGATTLNGGTLQAGSSTAFGAGGAIALNAGTLDLNTNNITASSLAGPAGTVVTASGAAGTSTLTLTAQNTAYSGAYNDGSRALALNLTTGGGNYFMPAASTYSGGTIITALTRVIPRNSTALGLGLVTVQNTGQVYIDSVGGTVNLLNNFNIAGDGAGAGGDPLLRGAIRDDNGSTVSGTVTLNSNASLGCFVGTGIFAGQITGNANLGINLEATNVGIVVLTNNFNNYTGTTTVGNASTNTAAPTTGLQLGSGGTSGALPAATAITLNGTAGLIFARTDNALTIGQTISGTGSIEQNGSGITYITGTNNSYTGLTQLNAGTLNVASIADYGVNCSIGARLLAQETATGNGIGIWFSAVGATLQYTGSTAQSSNRQMRFKNGVGNFIDASGSVPSATLSFTSTATQVNSFDTTGTRTLTLTGTNTGANTFSIPITNQAANATSLTKSGVGTWVVINSSNSYTGATAVNGGVLAANSLSSGATAVTVNSGGTLAPGTPSTPGTLTLPGTLTGAGGGAFNFRLIGTTGAGNDAIAATGAANFVATNGINLSGTPATGTAYTLVTTTGANTTLPVVGSNTTGLTPTLAKTATALTVTFSAAAPVNYVWANSGTNMNAAASWTPNGVPTANDTITFTTVTTQPALTAALSVSGMTISPAAGGMTMTGAFTLTIGAKGITASNTSGTNSINCNNVALSAAQTWLVATGGTLAFSNAATTSQMIGAADQPITFGNSTNKGTVTFTNANTGLVGTSFLGGFIINGGTVASENGANGGRTPLGSGPVIINNGGVLRSDAGDSFGYSSNGISNFTINAGGTMTTGAGAYRTTLSSGGTILLNGGTIAGAATGDGNGAGAFSLQGAAITVNNTSGTVSTISTKLSVQVTPLVFT